MPLVVLMYALFASVFTIGKVGLEYSAPLFLVGSRMLFAGILMVGYQYVTNRKAFYIQPKHYIPLFLLALFNIYLTNILEFWGLQYLPSFKACFLYSLSPFISALFSYFMFSETLGTKKWVGLIVGFISFIPILLNQTSAEELAGHISVFSWPELAVIGAAVASVYGWILLKRLVQDQECTPNMANAVSMVIGGTMALGNSWLVEEWNPVPVFDVVPYLECTFLLIIISNFMGYNLYGYLLKHFSATFLSFAGFMTPMFSALFGWLILGEVVTWPFYVSAIGVFSGLFLFYREELRAAARDPVTDV